MNTDAGQVTDGDITIDSNHETAEQIQTAFADDPLPVDAAAPEDVSASNTAPVNEPDVAPVKAKRRSDPTEAVKSAVAKQREAERRADAAEARMQAMVEPIQAEPTPGGGDWARFKQIPGVPTVDQFDAYEDYSMAMSAFVADVRHQERDAERAHAYQQHQYQQTQQAQTARWNGRLQDARSQNPDFE